MAARLPVTRGLSSAATFLGALGALGAALAAVLLAPAPGLLAQMPWQTSPLAVGFEHVTEEGESGFRVGGWWFPGDALAIGATGRNWGGYRVFEPEIRWLPAGRRGVYLAGSGIVQEHGGFSATGFGLAVGGQEDLLDRVVISAGLGWRSLYYADRADKKWFRLRSGLLLFL